jgi:hypothetical protein
LGGNQEWRTAGAAEGEFDVFITVDRKISTQQDLTKFKIPALLIRGGRTDWKTFVLWFLNF